MDGSLNLLEDTFNQDVVRVIRPDGSVLPGADPRLDVEQVRSMYVAMLETRLIDQRCERLQRQGRIGFHIGSLGEEACVIGSAAALHRDDWIFPCYREFGALLFRGFPLQRYVDNLFGNANDVVHGRQMPDHYTGKAQRFGSVSSPIGTQISQAVGFAWACKLKGEGTCVGVYFGDGATSAHDFHTGMNFAGVYQTPAVFLCRNNQWAISMPSDKQTASRTYADKGLAYGVRGVRCDGNDLLATYMTVRDAVSRARRGDGPTLVEMITYRLGGHSTSDDPRAYRAQQEVDAWHKVDPMDRTRRYLERLGEWSDEEEREAKTSIEARLKECVERAEQTNPPDLGTIFEGVYETIPAHLEAQREELLTGPRAPDPHGDKGGAS